eukprot:TRINITY_DN2954_c0_g1_i1.p1 TRINITY_DN2954_c0_g1~~TRINITY_DN2954_c0_g1_i1.p1  ORF type:complete len:846 (+),score=75.77 TRINITY_DN2954_c0_g1_i1:48-2585(+)
MPVRRAWPDVVAIFAIACALGVAPHSCAAQQPAQLSCLASYPPWCKNTTAPTPCCPGYGVAYFCPSPEQRSICPPGNFCPTPYSKFLCEKGYHCPNGSFVPVLCPGGFTCNDSAIEPSLCPIGHYCRNGTVTPRRCLMVALCPGGNTQPQSWILALIFQIAFFLLLFVGYFACKGLRDHWREIRHARRVESRRQRVFNILVSRGFDSNTGNTSADDDACSELQAMHLASQLATEESAALEQTVFSAPSLGFTDLTAVRHGFVFQNLSGQIGMGKVTAIVSPPELVPAPNSILLGVLSGRESPAAGAVTLNGEPVDMTLPTYRRYTGYVEQDVDLPATLTVKELLMFSALLRGRCEWDGDRRENYVDSVLSRMRLVSVKHTCIGKPTSPSGFQRPGLTAAERKRLAIAQEMVTMPSLLFLDNPTANLDPANALIVLECLRKIAKNGVTVVAAVGQVRNDALSRFDELLLLTYGGNTIYHGRRDRVVDYFQTYGFHPVAGISPAEYILDVAAGRAVSDIDVTCDGLPFLWGSSTYAQSFYTRALSAPSSVPQSERKVASLLSQAWVAFNRGMLQQARSITEFVVFCILFLLAGLIIGLTFFNATYIGPLPQALTEQYPTVIKNLSSLPQSDPVPAYASFVAILVGLLSVILAWSSFAAEHPWFVCLRSLGLSPAAFLIGRFLADIPRLLLAPLMFLSTFTPLVFPASPFWRNWYLPIFCSALACYGIGTFFALTFDRPLSAFLAVGTIMLSWLLGTPHALATEAVGPLSTFSFARWLIECLYVGEVSQYASRYHVDSGIEALGFDAVSERVWFVAKLPTYIACTVMLLSLVGFSLGTTTVVQCLRRG